MLACTLDNSRFSGNLRDSHENTSTASKSTHQVADNRESTNAGTTEGGGSRDDALELTVHALVTVTGHNHTLLLELLGDITRAGARNLDPGLGEDGAGGEHEGDVDDGVDGVEERGLDGVRRGHVVRDTGDGRKLRRVLERLRVARQKGNDDE